MKLKSSKQVATQSRGRVWCWREQFGLLRGSEFRNLDAELEGGGEAESRVDGGCEEKKECGKEKLKIPVEGYLEVNGAEGSEEFKVTKEYFAAAVNIF